MAEENQEPKKKKKKAKGPIRTGAVAPLIIVIVLFGVYFNYFFDGHLRWVLEFGGTYANGAEVNVGYVKMKWLEPGLAIGKIQVTNKEQPTHNLVEVGQIRLRLLWDGLLRGKFVIPESSIKNIMVGTKRRRPGRVLPPPKEKKGDSKAAKMAKEAADKTINQLKEKNDSNFLSDIIAIAEGKNAKDQLKQIEGELKTSVRLKELEKEVKNKEAEWKKRMDDLPDESEIKQLSKRVEGFKFDSKNPVAIQKSLKELDTIFKEAKTKYKSIEGAKKALDKDLKKYKNTMGDVEKMIKEDIDDLAKKMNLPSLDPQEITQMLLGNMIAGQLGKVEKYKNLARQYMPTKKPKPESDELTPVERAEGRNFKFLKKKAYPKFWLQKATISSKASEGGFSGDLSGTVLDVTTSPRHLGKPTKVNVTGDFPHSEIYGMVADIVVDHTTDVPKEIAAIKVDKFPVSKNTFTKSSDVEFGFNKALGKSKMKVIYEAGVLNIASNSLFAKVDYFVDAKSSKVKEILNNITRQLQKIDLNIRAKGSWEDLKLNINSNLGRKVADAIKGEVQAQIKQARAKLEKQVRGAIAKEKGKLNNEVAKLEKQLGISLKNREDAVKSVENLVSNKKNEAKNKEKKKLEAKAKKELKKVEEKLSDKDKKKLNDLKKKFKLGF